MRVLWIWHFKYYGINTKFIYLSEKSLTKPVAAFLHGDISSFLPVKYLKLASPSVAVSLLTSRKTVSCVKLQSRSETQAELAAECLCAACIMNRAERCEVLAFMAGLMIWLPGSKFSSDVKKKRGGVGGRGSHVCDAPRIFTYSNFDDTLLSEANNPLLVQKFRAPCHVLRISLDYLHWKNPPPPFSCAVSL